MVKPLELPKIIIILRLKQTTNMKPLLMVVPKLESPGIRTISPSTNSSKVHCLQVKGLSYCVSLCAPWDSWNKNSHLYIAYMRSVYLHCVSPCVPWNLSLCYIAYKSYKLVKFVAHWLQEKGLSELFITFCSQGLYEQVRSF